MGATLVAAALAFAAGFAIAWFVGGPARRALGSAQRELSTTQETLAVAERARAESLESERELSAALEEARDDNQKLKVHVTELERRIHDNAMWEGKYEKLLKENQVYATKVSELEKTKVELNFCRQQLEAARKKAEAAAGPQE